MNFELVDPGRQMRRACTAFVALAACLQMPCAWAADISLPKTPAPALRSLTAQANPTSAQGSWNFVMKTPVGDRKISFKFAVDGNALKGTMTDDDGTSEIFNGSVEGATLKWSAKVSKPMSMTLEFTGVIDGDTIGGGAKSLFGTAKFTAQRA